MILLDANLLLYAYGQDFPQHQAAKRWLESAMEQRQELGLAWIVILAFLRISTNAKPYANALSLAEATDIVDELLAESNVSIVNPGTQHWGLLKAVSKEGAVQRNLYTDAHLAALAIEHDAALCTNDRDFLRFKGVRLMNPLQAQ